MTTTTVSVTGDDVHSSEQSDDEVTVYATEFDRVHVSFGEDGYEPECRHCHEFIEQDGDRWRDRDGDVACVDNPDGFENAIDGPHEPLTGPNTWCNSASVIADDDEDSVMVTISVGDPRGAFGFTIRRLPDDAPEHGGCLIMHLPYPGEPLPHMTLTQLHTGTFLIG